MEWIIIIALLLCVCAAAWFAARALMKSFADISKHREFLVSRGAPKKADGTREKEEPGDSFLEPESVRIPSAYGYDLACEMYVCEDSEKGVVLCHAAGSSKEELRAYAQIFLERGITVLAYDQRGHGGSGDDPCGFGFFETPDARACVDYLENTLGETARIGIWGTGMGAAVAAGLIKQDDRIEFAVLDTVYADLASILEVWLKNRCRGFYCKPMLHVLDVVNRYEYKWSIFDVAPLRGMAKTKCPLLLIQGAADTLVPAENAYRFALERKDARLVIFPKAAHGCCRASNPAEYRRVVQKFLIRADF